MVYGHIYEHWQLRARFDGAYFQYRPRPAIVGLSIDRVQQSWLLTGLAHRHHPWFRHQQRQARHSEYHP